MTEEAPPAPAVKLRHYKARYAGVKNKTEFLDIEAEDAIEAYRIAYQKLGHHAHIYTVTPGK